MICNECGNDISAVSHKSWCSDYKSSDMVVTPKEINALTENVRRYVMELESQSDASGYVQRIAWLEHENAALQVVIKELKNAKALEDFGDMLQRKCHE